MGSFKTVDKRNLKEELKEELKDKSVYTSHYESIENKISKDKSII